MDEAPRLTKDSDFVRLLEQLGFPPRILWLTIGNTSNARLKEVLSRTFALALELLRRGEPLVEIAEQPQLSQKSTDTREACRSLKSRPDVPTTTGQSRDAGLATA